VAPLFLEWLDPPAAKSWVDIGCGTGELSLAIADRCAPGRLLGIDSSLPFLAVARQRVPLASFVRGDALRLALPDGEFDHAVSGLVLNFLPDAARALAEMARVTRPGGTVALYVWDYAGQMQVMRHFFDAARLVDPASAAHDDGLRSPICRPAPLRDAFLAAGLAAPETVALDIPAAFVDFEDYWSPFFGRHRLGTEILRRPERDHPGAHPRPGPPAASHRPRGGNPAGHQGLGRAGARAGLSRWNAPRPVRRPELGDVQTQGEVRTVHLHIHRFAPGIWG